MSKTPKMRWRKRDTDLIEKTLKNFNSKIYYHKNKNKTVDTSYLPNTITKKEAVQSITTRAEFNELVKSLQAFSKKGAEKPFKSKRGMVTTTWAVEEFNRKQELENKRRKRELKRLGELEVKQGGKDTGVKRKEMGTVWQNSLKESKKDPKNLTQKEWEKASKNIDRFLNETTSQEARERMQNNYLQGLKDGGFLGRIPGLEEAIKEKSADEFYTIAMTDVTATFEFYRDPIEWEIRAEEIAQAWGVDYIADIEE